MTSPLDPITRISTTQFGCTPASATSHPPTNTNTKEKPSAKPDEMPSPNNSAKIDPGSTLSPTNPVPPNKSA